MSEIRQRILEALGDVPRTIAKVEKDLENFHADETLSDLVDELYIITLTAIEGMMKWLVDKDGCKCMIYNLFSSDVNVDKGNKSRPYFSVLRTASHRKRRLRI